MDALRLAGSAPPLRRADLVVETDRQRKGVKDLQASLERLLPRLRMAVIYGGDKSEDGAVINPTVNRRPWKSYQTVATDIAGALERLGVGHVEVVPENMRLGTTLEEQGIHLAWLNTGGVQGIGALSHAPAMLEMPLSTVMMSFGSSFSATSTISGDRP